MAKWYAVFSSETRFKPVPGGYVFQSPAFTGDGRNRIVNEAQKTAIMNILERWALLRIGLSLAFPLMVPVGVIVIAQVAAIWHPSPGQAAAAFWGTSAVARRLALGQSRISPNFSAL
jgi:hypothetical protein